MPRAHYFVGGRAFGTSEFHDVVWAPSSYKLVCPECGSVWGEVLVEESAATWAVSMLYCAKHGARWERLVADFVPGSICQTYLNRAETPDASTALAFQSLPLLLKNREVLLRIHRLERLSNAQK